MKNGAIHWVLPAVTGAFIILLWYTARHFGWVAEFMLPAPHRILAAIWEHRVEMLKAGAYTFYAAALGFVAAVAGGAAIAMLLASHRWIKASFHPFVLMLQMTPVIVITPIIGLWLEHALGRIVSITFIISFFPVVANTTLGLVSTDKNLIDLFNAYGATRLQEILFLKIPFAVPYFLTGMKIAGTLAPIGAITGDFLLGTSRAPGLGFLLLTYLHRGQIDALFGIAVLACLAGFAFVALVFALDHMLLQTWHESKQRVE